MKGFIGRIIKKQKEIQDSDPDRKSAVLQRDKIEAEYKAKIELAEGRIQEIDKRNNTGILASDKHTILEEQQMENYNKMNYDSGLKLLALNQIIDEYISRHGSKLEKESVSHIACINVIINNNLQSFLPNLRKQEKQIIANRKNIAQQDKKSAQLHDEQHANRHKPHVYENRAEADKAAREERQVLEQHNQIGGEK